MHVCVALQIGVSAFLQSAFVRHCTQAPAAVSHTRPFVHCAVDVHAFAHVWFGRQIALPPGMFAHPALSMHCTHE
jgi:hypothetical protein